MFVLQTSAPPVDPQGPRSPRSRARTTANDESGDFWSEVCVCVCVCVCV